MAKTILIVDDNSSFRHAACELFGRLPDFEVCGEGGNGQEAIAKAKELHPDLIVLDISMPLMNGLEAARILRQIMPDMPIILSSVAVDRWTERHASLLGVSAVFSKASPASELIAKARHLLSIDYPVAA